MHSSAADRARDRPNCQRGEPARATGTGISRVTQRDGESESATSGDRLLRPDVAYEAIRLTRTLAALQPDEPEVHGLLALCELTAARFPARTGPDGAPILLEDQDRRLWDFSAIHRGLTALAKASAPTACRP